MQNDLKITGLVPTEDGLEIGYVRLPRDVRKNGLIWQHSVLVPQGSDYDDALDTFYEVVLDLLKDVLEDEELAEPIDLSDLNPEDADDEEED